MKIWAHRGCSLKHPENTLAAFRAAAKLDGLTGVELDAQLTADGQVVVIHDERVDRTTTGRGLVRHYVLSDLKKLRIRGRWRQPQTVPTLAEVLELLAYPMSRGLLLNIEFKNGVVPYEGMEKLVIELVKAHKLQDRVIYSSFNPESLKIVRQLAPEARLGLLDTSVSRCLEKIDNGCPANDLHPGWDGIDAPRDKLSGYNVRAYGHAPIFPARENFSCDLNQLAALGITDVFVNDPENYLA